MFQRIKAALINPRANVRYMNDSFGKFIIYILIYVLLFTLPYIPLLLNIGTTFSETLAKSVNFTERVNYEIKDKKLVALDDAKPVVLKFSSSLVYETYLAIGEEINYSFPTNKQLLIIHLDTDGIYFMNRSGESQAKVMNYNDNYIDLTKLSENDQATINGLFSYVGLYLKSHQALVFGAGLPILFLTNTFYVFGIALLISLFSFISFRALNLRFKKAFRMAILSMTPVVVSFMFSIFLERNAFGNLLYWAGFIITTIYNYRLGTSYIIYLKQKEIEENKHEL